MVKGGQAGAGGGPGKGDRAGSLAQGRRPPRPGRFRSALSRGDPRHDAVKTLKQYGLWKQVPLAVRGHLDRGICGELEPAPSPRDDCFGRVDLHVVGNGPAAARAACAAAEELGYEAQLLTGTLGGEARRAGAFLASTAQTLARRRGGRQAAALRGDRRRDRARREAGTADRAQSGTGPRRGAGDRVLWSRCWLPRWQLRRGTGPPRPPARSPPGPPCGGPPPPGWTAAGGAAWRRHQGFAALDDLIVSGSTGTDVGDLQLLLLSAEKTGTGSSVARGGPFLV